MNSRSTFFFSVSKLKTIFSLIASVVILEYTFEGYNSKYTFYLISASLVYLLLIDPRTNKQSFQVYLRRSIESSFVLLAIGFIIGVFFDLQYSLYPAYLILGFSSLDLVLYVLLRLLASRLRVNEWNLNKLVIVGSGKCRDKLKSYVASSPFEGHSIVAEFDINYETKKEGIQELSEFLEINEANEIIVIERFADKSIVGEVIQIADRHGLRLRIIPDFNGILNDVTLTLNKFGDMPVVNLRIIPLDRFRNKVLKRALDLVLSTILILLLSPLFLLLAILIPLDSKGPVLYKPKRVGMNKKAFFCLKFRTMIPNTKDQSTVKDDPRITRVGKILRKTSLDELPQLFNILIGQMSLVGPRPHRLSLNKEFQDSMDGYMVRHYIKPGLTGWAQVHNFRGPTVTLESKLNRKEYDNWYIANWTIWLDLKILILTIVRVPFQKNAF